MSIDHRLPPSTASARRRLPIMGACAALTVAVAITVAVPSAQAAIGDIGTIAGTGVAGFAGDGGPATAAQLEFNQQSAYDSAGNLYVADFTNNRVRRIAVNGTISTVAGTGAAASSGDGGPAASAALWSPEGLVIDGADNIYVGEFFGHRIRKFTVGGTISTYAGTGTLGDTGDGGPAAAAEIGQPSGMGIDPTGNLYFTQTSDDVVRKVDTLGVITRVAGNGTSGFSGDGGAATSAQLSNPRGVSVVNGNLMISDSGNHRIRSVGLGGTIVTIAGNGTAGFAGDGGLADDAELNFPEGIVSTGLQLYVADSANNRIRKIENGIITTVAGTGAAGYTGDGGPALQATMDFPVFPTIDPVGNLVFSDADNNVVRRIQITTAVPGSTTTTTSTTSTTSTTTPTPAPRAATPITVTPSYTG